MERDPFVLESNDPTPMVQSEQWCYNMEHLPTSWVYNACPDICIDLGRCGLA